MFEKIPNEIVANFDIPPERAELRSRLTRLATIQAGTDLRKTRFEWVYAVQVEATPPLIKIGRAYRLEKRLRNLQACCGVPMKILAAFIAPRGTEFVLHEVWQYSRMHGEWFWPDEDILASLSLFPKAGTMTEVDLVKFTRARKMRLARLKAILYAGVRRKNRKVRRSRAAVAA